MCGGAAWDEPKEQHVTQRVRLDDLTSDALDALYERAETAEKRLRLAHQARRAKEHQLDDIRRALCDAGLMEDDDPYSHADLADLIRQTAPAEAADAREQLRLVDGMRQQNLDSAAAAIQRAEHAEAALREVLALLGPVTVSGRTAFYQATKHPIHPDDMDRWRAALDEPGPAAGGCSAPGPRTEPNNTSPA